MWCNREVHPKAGSEVIERGIAEALPVDKENKHCRQDNLWNEGIRRFDVLVRRTPENRRSPESIQQILISAQDDVKIPLDELTTIEEIVGPHQSTREKNQQFITVETDVRSRDIGPFVEEAENAINTKGVVPTSYVKHWGEQFELQRKTNNRLSLAVPIMLFIVSFHYLQL